MNTAELLVTWVLACPHHHRTSMDHHQLEVVVRVLLEEMAAAGRCHCWAISPEVWNIGSLQVVSTQKTAGLLRKHRGGRRTEVRTPCRFQRFWTRIPEAKVDLGLSTRGKWNDDYSSNRRWRRFVNNFSFEILKVNKKSNSKQQTQKVTFWRNSSHPTFKEVNCRTNLKYFLKYY